jgi:hypothetical protein
MKGNSKIEVEKVSAVVVRPTLTDRIRQAQDKDEILKKTRAKVESGKETYFHIDP